MAQSGHNAKLEATGTAVSHTQEAMSVIAGTSNQVWGINDGTKDIFDVAATHTVEASEDNGTSYATLGAGEFTLQYLIGRVDIDNYTSGSGTVANITDVRISGDHLPKFERASVSSSSNEKTLNLEDSSTYGDGGVRRDSIRQDFTASIDDYDRGIDPLDGSGGTEDSILDLLKTSRVVVLSITPDRATASPVIRAWVKLSTGSSDLPGDGLLEESIDAEGAYQETAMSTQTASVWDYRT